MLCGFNAANAQRLTFEKLEQLLNQSLDEAEESLFLVGYLYLSKNEDSTGSIYIFSNRKNTIGTAKLVAKCIDPTDPRKSFIKYTTYERAEFQKFRKLMVDAQFTRSTADSISENSNFHKDNLKVNFEIGADQYENETFSITLRNSGIVADKKPKRITLKEFFRQ